MSAFDSDALESEIVLVTGATGGIGSSTAETLAGMGANLLLTGRDESRLADVRESAAASSSGRVITQRADLTEKNERKRLLTAANDEFGGVTMLVNAAGTGGSRTAFEDLSEEELTRITEINYTATVLLTQAVYRELKKAGQGAIVNVSSLSGLRGTYQSVPYCGSKFALTGFTQSLSLEAIEHDIRVNAVCPGWVDTKMAHQGMKEKAEAKGRTYEEQRERERESIPSNRITSPEETANTIAFLLTDAAENIVGESLKISGGVYRSI